MGPSCVPVGVGRRRPLRRGSVMRVVLAVVLLTGATVWTPGAARAATAAWSGAGAMTKPRAETVALLLRDGRVLVLAGAEDAGAGGVDADIFDPATGVWSRS